MIYLDTGCLLKLYYPEPESPRIAKLVVREAIVFIALHQLEVDNALELKLFRKEAAAAQVRQTRTLIENDLRAGVLYRPSVVWEDLLKEASNLAKTHTRTIGCRSLEVIHCAAAARLASTSFITTDVRQRRLAKKVGLTCPVV